MVWNIGGGREGNREKEPTFLYFSVTLVRICSDFSFLVYVTGILFSCAHHLRIDLNVLSYSNYMLYVRFVI